MLLQNKELLEAMAWRVRMISYFQRLIEATLLPSGLSDISRHCLRLFASEEIERLNVADQDAILRLYHEAMAAQLALSIVIDQFEEVTID